MPLATIRVKNFKVHEVEKVYGFNYGSFAQFLQQSCSNSGSKMTKEDLQRFLLLSQGDRERKCI